MPVFHPWLLRWPKSLALISRAYIAHSCIQEGESPLANSYYAFEGKQRSRVLALLPTCWVSQKEWKGLQKVGALQMNSGSTAVLQVLFPCAHSSPEFTLWAFGFLYFKEKHNESQSKLQITECFLLFRQAYHMIRHKLVVLDPTPRCSSASMSQKCVHLRVTLMWVCRERTCI